MKLFRLLPLVAAIALSGCGDSDGGGKQPEGQVVATVGGEEITMRELAAELQGATNSDPELAKAVERSALQAIVNRKILARAAREDGFEKGAEFQLARQRAEDLLLAQSLQRKIASQIARPSREEGEKYMAAHPNNFAQRKIYAVDQIQFASAPNKLKEFSTMQTLDQLEQKLISEGSQYKRAPASIDALDLPPQMAAMIAKVPTGKVFVIPSSSTVVANGIKEARVVPFTGEAAIAQAQQMQFKERVTEAVTRQMDELRKKAGKVSYKAGYGPPPGGPNSKTSRPAAGTTGTATAAGKAVPSN